MKNRASFSTPILFIIYDRSDTALQVFDVIKKIKPEKFFIASDGPAERYSEEKDNVFSLRQKILNDTNWKCNIKTLFGEKNLGPRNWISSAITWFFDNVEEGIILEHDCLPDESFFFFCQELLNKYRSNNRVMHISGANFLFGKTEINSSYYFSKYPFIWGWATWKRAWEKYDIDMAGWENFNNNEKLKDILKSKLEQDYWKNVFKRTENGRFHTWDYQWIFTIWNNKGLSINFSRNLVSNIGYDERALNTYYSNCILSKIKLDKIEKLIHPSYMAVNDEADSISFEYYFGEHISVLFNQNDLLHDECEKRLKLINDLTHTAQERLKVIDILDEEIKRLKSG